MVVSDTWGRFVVGSLEGALGTGGNRIGIAAGNLAEQEDKIVGYN